MTYLTTVEDSNGRTIDFERWNYKRPSTVRQKLYNLYTEYSGLYRKILQACTVIKCYSTPDGYNRGYIEWELPTVYFIAADNKK